MQDKSLEGLRVTSELFVVHNDVEKRCVVLSNSLITKLDPPNPNFERFQVNFLFSLTICSHINIIIVIHINIMQAKNSVLLLQIF